MIPSHSQSSNNPWLVVPRPNPRASIRLFCFPYAGSGAVVYRTWPNDLSAEIELFAAQLPGRENRFRETPLQSLAEVVSALAAAVYPYLDRPFALFGHSLGGLIAFELAHYLREQWGCTPLLFFASARRAPHLPEPLSPIHALPGDEFIAQVQKRYGGIPQAILQTPELLHAMLPMLRADFALFEKYAYRARPPLTCPIIAFGGEHDQIVRREEIAAWREHTSARFTLRLVDGDHFFVRHAQSALVREISQQLFRVWEAQPVAHNV